MSLTSQPRGPAGAGTGGRYSEASQAEPDVSAAPLGWPGLDYEEVPWDLHPVTGQTRQDRLKFARPYRASIPPGIRKRDIRLSGQVAAEAEEAAAEIAQFDNEMGHKIAPYSAILLRSESASSSQIEQLSASARRIAEAEVTGVGTAHAEQVVANVRAMTAALALADQLDEGAILEMHDALMRPSEPETAGRWRDGQVWIGGPAPLGPGSPHLADFVPPVADRVPGAIHDLVEFVRRTDLPALPQTAVAHAQFETIHPFPDGNGRTGRALLHAMLRSKGIARHISVPISSGILTDIQGYFSALTAYRTGDIEPVVSSVSRAALVGVANGRVLVEDLTRVRSEWEERLAGLRSDAGARRLADGLLRYPVIAAAQAREVLGISKNEHRHIDALVERGILTFHQDYKTRNMTWRAQDVLDALDRYSANVGRRQP